MSAESPFSVDGYVKHPERYIQSVSRGMAMGLEDPIDSAGASAAPQNKPRPPQIAKNQRKHNQMIEPGEIPVYVVCDACKLTKIERESNASRAWARQHAEHGMLDLVAEPIFRSDHITRFSGCRSPRIDAAQASREPCAGAKRRGSILRNSGRSTVSALATRRMRVTPQAAAPVAPEPVEEAAVETETRQILAEMTHEDAEMGVYDTPRATVSFKVAAEGAERVAIILGAARIPFTRG